MLNINSDHSFVVKIVQTHAFALEGDIVALYDFYVRILSLWFLSSIVGYLFSFNQHTRFAHCSHADNVVIQFKLYGVLHFIIILAL